MKRVIAIVLTVVLSSALLTACKSNQQSTTSAQTDAATTEAQTEKEDQTTEASSEQSEEELTRFEVKDFGTFYLPADFKMKSGVMEEPFTLSYVQFTRGDVTITVNHFTQDVYDATGTIMPADLNEYCQRPGAQNFLPEGKDYTEDAYGNMFVDFVQDGVVNYIINMKGATSYATVSITYPENTEGVEDIPSWFGKASIE